MRYRRGASWCGPSTAESSGRSLRAALFSPLLAAFVLVCLLPGDAVTLVRERPTSDRWVVDPDDVERLARANGIPEPGLLDRSLREYASTRLPS